MPSALGEGTKLPADKQLAGEEQSGCRLNRLGADSLGDSYKTGIFFLSRFREVTILEYLLHADRL